KSGGAPLGRRRRRRRVTEPLTACPRSARRSARRSDPNETEPTATRRARHTRHMRIIRRAQNVKFQSLSQSRNPPDQRAAQQSPGECYPFALKHGRFLSTPSNSAHKVTGAIRRDAMPFSYICTVAPNAVSRWRGSERWHECNGDQHSCAASWVKGFADRALVWPGSSSNVTGPPDYWLDISAYEAAHHDQTRS